MKGQREMLLAHCHSGALYTWNEELHSILLHQVSHETDQGLREKVLSESLQPPFSTVVQPPIAVAAILRRSTSVSFGYGHNDRLAVAVQPPT